MPFPRGVVAQER